MTKNLESHCETVRVVVVMSEKGPYFSGGKKFAHIYGMQLPSGKALAAIRGLRVSSTLNLQLKLSLLGVWSECLTSFLG